MSGSGRLGRYVRGVSEMTVATDGACTGNPGPAGWAWVVDGDCWEAGSLGRATNNVAELEGIRRVLLSAPTDVSLVVLTDSQYSRNALTVWLPGWRRNQWRTKGGQPVKNAAQVRQCAELMEHRSGHTRIEWVRGHNGHPLNEAADRLATAMVKASPHSRMLSGPGWCR